jgi:hypothetical protein
MSKEAMFITAITAMVVVVGTLSGVIGKLYQKLSAVDKRQEKRLEQQEKKLEEHAIKLVECVSDRQCLREALIIAGIPIPKRGQDRGDG